MRRWVFVVWIIVGPGRRAIPWTLDHLHIVLPWLAVAAVIGWMVWEAMRKPRVKPKPEIVFLESTAGAPLPCAICRGELSGDVVRCASCRTPHHRECFRFVGTCSVYACRSRAA
jgi:hypothetical protein